MKNICPAIVLSKSSGPSPHLQVGCVVPLAMSRRLALGAAVVQVLSIMEHRRHVEADTRAAAAALADAPTADRLACMSRMAMKLLQGAWSLQHYSNVYWGIPKSQGRTVQDNAKNVLLLAGGAMLSNVRQTKRGCESKILCSRRKGWNSGSFTANITQTATTVTP